MCLIIDRKIHPVLEPLTAQEDIIVYKVMIFRDNRLMSPYQEFHYNLNTTYGPVDLVAAIGNTLSKMAEINEGFHSWKEFANANFGIQAFGFNRLSLGIFEAIIPQGSKYFEGINYDMVSNNIIIKQKICV